MTGEESRFPSTGRLGIVLDIDGTLIAEGKRVHNVRIRPGAVDFLSWCKRRGHAVSLWTKAHPEWADRVASKICPLVTRSDGRQHKCSGIDCRATFDFIWCGDKLRRQREPSMKWQCKTASDPNTILGSGLECRWCEIYSSRCNQCEFHWNYTCPCREVKDLRKIWHSSDEETRNFVKERTLIVENTPQNCIYNYGNAIYVPTYKGSLPEESTFTRMRAFFEKLETSKNVREVPKCHHGPHYHACFEQAWLAGA